MNRCENSSQGRLHTFSDSKRAILLELVEYYTYVLENNTLAIYVQ